MYGTLRLGSPNEYATWLAQYAKHAGYGLVRGRLYRVAYYPALGPALSEDDWVKGDLFDNVSGEVLERLDDYEGTDYTRELMEITMDSGGLIQQAFAYRWSRSIDALQWLPSGDWNSLTRQSSVPE